MIAIGFITGIDLVARAGALAVLAGGLAAATHGLVVHLDRGRGSWTTDIEWHRFTGNSMLLGQVWFGLGLALAAIRLLVLGATPASWALSLVVGPLVIGGALQILIGAMAHLTPTVGPGDPIRHASQRQLVGRWAKTRIVLLNAGAAGVEVGFGLGSAIDGGALGPTLVGLGLGSAAIALGGTLVLLAVAARPDPTSRFATYDMGSGPRACALGADGSNRAIVRPLAAADRFDWNGRRSER